MIGQHISVKSVDLHCRGKNDEASMYIPVSLLDSGADGLKLKERLFVESKACWEEI